MADSPPLLCSAAAFTEGPFGDLVENYTPIALNNLLAEATRKCESAAGRRLVPFTNVTETHRAEGMDPDEYTDTANLPTPAVNTPTTATTGGSVWNASTCEAAVDRGPAINGVLLDTAQDIARHAPRIYTQVVTTRAMPLANLTHMTEAERAQIGAWYTAGATTGRAP